MKANYYYYTAMLVVIALTAVKPGQAGQAECIDGRTYPDPYDCTKYTQCVNGRIYIKHCSPGTVYSDQPDSDHSDECVIPGSDKDTCSPLNPARECKRGLVKLIPHPTACQRYFNCSDTSPRRGDTWVTKFEPYEAECPYPQVFDVLSKRCVHYKGAVCGRGRIAAKWKCEYFNSFCNGEECIPCYMKMCAKKPDGVWAADDRMWTPMFVQCSSNEYQQFGECPQQQPAEIPQLFHPDKRRCLPMWEIPREHGGFETSCEGKLNGHYRVKDMGSITYQCPEKKFFYCPMGESIGQCTPL